MPDVSRSIPSNSTLADNPQSIFQEKDYLNYRYFYKRAYYLACIAAGIKKSTEHKFQLAFDCLSGNYLLPILVVRSTKGN
jgi:U3 small nucleolar RNA-associated protein 22